MTTEENRKLFSLSVETPEIPKYDSVSNWASAVSATSMALFLQTLFLFSLIPFLYSLQMALDLDIAMMSELMAKGTFDDFMNAKEVYEFGAFAWPYADLQMDGGSPREIVKGTRVTGNTILNEPIRGYVLEHVKARQGKMRIEYEVDSTSTDAVALQCSVGGNPSPNFDACKCPTTTSRLVQVLCCSRRRFLTILFCPLE